MGQLLSLHPAPALYPWVRLEGGWRFLSAVADLRLALPHLQPEQDLLLEPRPMQAVGRRLHRHRLELMVVYTPTLVSVSH